MSESDDETNIPRRKIDAVRALSTTKPSLIGELLDDILSEHPRTPNSITSWYGSQRLAVLDEKLPVATAESRCEDAPAIIPGAKSPIATRCAPLLYNQSAESSDDYPAVVAVLDGKTRVIECANAIQWIIQKRNGGKWRSTHFCRTKEGLLLYAAPVTPGLLAFPDYFLERKTCAPLDASGNYAPEGDA